MSVLGIYAGCPLKEAHRLFQLWRGLALASRLARCLWQASAMKFLIEFDFLRIFPVRYNRRDLSQAHIFHQGSRS